MKKLFYTAAAVFTFGLVSAQDAGFKAGINVAIPVGDAGTAYSFGAGIDAAYTFEVADKFVVGGTTGYTYFSGKSILGFKASAAGIIPIAATAQYSVADNFFVGADLGYGLATFTGGSEGGLYYHPKVGYQTEKIELYAGYRAVSVTGGSFSSVALGLFYKF